MNNPTMETLARRLDRVERENRRLKRVRVVALVGIIAWGTFLGGFPGSAVAAKGSTYSGLRRAAPWWRLIPQRT